MTVSLPFLPKVVIPWKADEFSLSWEARRLAQPAHSPGVWREQQQRGAGTFQPFLRGRLAAGVCLFRGVMFGFGL